MENNPGKTNFMDKSLDIRSAWLQIIADTFYSLDDQWRFAVVNPAAELAPFGRPASELIGKVIWDLYPGLVGTTIQTHYLDAAEKHSLEHYEALSPLNGRWYEVFMQGRKGGVDVYMRDITERKRSEEALQTTLKCLQALVTSMPTGILLVGEDRVELANQAFCDFFALKESPGDLAGLSSSEIIEKIRNVYDDPQKEIDRIREIVRLGKPVVGEEVQMRGGRTFLRDFIPITSDGKYYGRLWYHTDISNRKKMEQDLRASEAKANALIKYAPTGIFEVDYRGPSFITINDAMCKILDFTREELLSMNPARLIEERDRPIFTERIRRQLAGGKIEDFVEYRVMKKDGSFVDAALNISTDPTGNDPNTVLVVANDITERKRMEAALKKSEKSLAEAQRIGHVGSWEWNIQTGEISWSAELFRFYGKDPGTYVPTMSSFGDYVHPDDRENVNGFINKILATGASVDFDFRVIADDGSTHMLNTKGEITQFDHNGKPLLMVGINLDITDRKNAENALKASEKKYRDLLETSGSIIILWSPDGLIKYINDYGLKFFGYEREEMVGHPVVKIVPKADWDTGEDLTHLAEKVLRSLSNSADMTGYSENANVKKNGEEIWVMWGNKAYVDEKGNVTEILAIGNDITDLKKSKEVLNRDNRTLEKIVGERTSELVNSRIELERSRHLADIGMLASSIAHELRNPLGAIRMAAYNIKKKVRAPEIEGNLANINKKVSESDQIINNLLTFSKLKPPSYEVIRISEMLGDCINTIAAKYSGWKVTLKRSLACEEDAVIEADFTQLKMVISNILDNAYQALRDKAGTITVALKPGPDASWEISITDNGVGLDKDIQERIFEPFYTTKAKGTGLGLAVCKEIVDMHGGKIKVHGEKGQGATFSIILPAHQPTRPSDGQNQELSEIDKQKGGK
jgi:PAS domain S-box-containing protein